MNGDSLRFCIVASQRGYNSVYFRTWEKGDPLWSSYEHRRQFWMLDEAEAVVRYCGIGRVIIEQVAA